MKFSTAAILRRSAVIELENSDRYEMDEPCTVYVDGTEVQKTRKNVITIDGLQPDHEYVIAVEKDGLKDKKAIHTEPESVLLDVHAFGALGDGKHDDTACLQAAILSCPKDGTVYVKAGTYLSGPLFMKSCISLWLDEGAEILGKPDRLEYPVLPGMVQGTDEEHEYSLSSWEGNPLDSYASLITMVDVHDFSLFGKGTINGNAAASDWWNNHKKKRGAWRPDTVFMNHCHNILMEGVTVKNSPCWTIHPYYSDTLQFLNLSIQNPYDSPNTDGFDPESCEDVQLLGTVISVGDDCVAIKSGKYYMSRYHFRRTSSVTIRNCRLERGHGSVTVGSEISCGVSDVRISQCIFANTDRGLRIKTRRGRGDTSILDNIEFENILMQDVSMPVTLNMYYFCDPDGHSDYVQDQRPMEVNELTPHIGVISLKDAECTGVQAAFLTAVGLPEAPIERVEVDHVKVSFAKDPQACLPVMMDGFDPMKGRSVYARNVKDLELHDVTIQGALDQEPELVNVEHSSFSALTYTG
jgi:polygalacturonase